MTAKEIRFSGTPEEISKAWHEQRDKGVGGSDVGVIMGVNHYKDIMQLWREKTGKAKPEDISHKPAVILGNAVEPALRNEYAYRHPSVKVEEPQYMLQDDEHPWRQASLDGVLTYEDGRKEVLEIKTVGWLSAQYWEPDTVPVSYACQVLHYMAVSGYRQSQLIAMISNSRIIERSVERDELRCYPKWSCTGMSVATVWMKSRHCYRKSAAWRSKCYSGNTGRTSKMLETMIALCLIALTILIGYLGR